MLFDYYYYYYYYGIIYYYIKFGPAVGREFRLQVGC